MLFMVVEHFAEGKASEVYRNFREKGRQQPDGLRYVDSWISVSLDICFQLMECDDPALLQEWIARWESFMRCEVIPVTTSKQTFAIMEMLANEKNVDQG
ncbi:MAG TPA: DUF3303 family protein [Thermomicrobiales bacterium]|nr:DUF3303 family protein [Thermomicrobiales bacterium]